MKIFGEIFPQHNSLFAAPECLAIHYISNQDKLEDGRVYIPGEGYHTDHSNDAEPPKATALHAVKLPKTGGDTQFVNMVEAYDALPAAMKAKIDRLSDRAGALSLSADAQGRAAGLIPHSRGMTGLRIPRR